MAALDIDVLARFAPGSGLLAATVGPDGAPRASRAWSVRLVDADLGRVRVLVSADDPVAVSNLSIGAIAVTAANVRTYESAQLKGRVVTIEAPSDADLATLRTDAERFFAEIQEVDGMPIEQTRRILPHEAIAVVFDVDEQYDQSPGPTAGRPLVAGT